MQLKKKTVPAQRHIGVPLAAATCALLGQTAPGEVIAQELAPWTIDTSMLLYNEDGGRVSDLSLNAIARKELREDGFLNLTFAYDSLTGASPSGAVPSPAIQTFTSPSGDAQYSVARERASRSMRPSSTRAPRSARAGRWPVTRLALLSVGASVSDEYDYTHTGVNARIARDFNNRNTTLSFGMALANDTINAVGGTPVPLAPMLGLGDTSNKVAGDQSKDVLDFLVGVTQVVNRRTVVQINYSLSQSDGYLTDPYKIISVVDPVTGAVRAGTGRQRSQPLPIRKPPRDARQAERVRAGQARLQRRRARGVLPLHDGRLGRRLAHVRRALPLELEPGPLFPAARAVLHSDRGRLLRDGVVCRATICRPS